MTPLLETMDATGLPLPIENLDTDQLMPKQFLRIVDKAGLADGLLHDLRFDGQGRLRQESILNDARYQNASILIGGANFGCGSSREHAVWGLQQYGIAAIIAPSFAEIFYSNAMNNRLLLIAVPPGQVEALMHASLRDPQASIHIDLRRQLVKGADGGEYHYPIGERHKRMVIEGIDTIGLTLQSLDRIQAYEQRHHASHPWALID